MAGTRSGFSSRVSATSKYTKRVGIWSEDIRVVGARVDLGVAAVGVDDVEVDADRRAEDHLRRGGRGPEQILLDSVAHVLEPELRADRAGPRIAAVQLERDRPARGHDR